MKTLVVRLPEPLVADIDAESRDRGLTRSDVVRERLEGFSPQRVRREPRHDIADVIGSVDGLPADLSGSRKHYLQSAR